MAAAARPFPGALLVVLVLLVCPGARAATYTVPRFSDTAVVVGLNQPTDFAFLPDGRILILEKPGRVLVTGPSGGTASIALDISGSVDDGFEKGMLGICLHPTFAANGYVYLYYTANGPKNRISRFTLTGSALGSELVVLDNIEATNGNHNGGTILIGPDGKLWAAPGDSGTGGAKAQDLSAASASRFNGKVLRMELDGSPAAGNPFLGDASKEPRIWAYGFRNPFRFSFRPSTSRIYIGDVGQSTLEELDVGSPGGNFGWPYLEGTSVFSGACPMTTTCIPPVFEYARSVGTTITAGVFVTGNAYPTLQGKYVFGDYGHNWIKYLEFDANDGLIGGSNALQNVATSAEGPVAFHQGPDGNLYYAAIRSGRLYRINYATDFFSVTPCRVLDTRGSGAPVVAGADRTFVIGGSCSIPLSARAVSVNLTVTQPTALGHLTIFPGGGAPPNTSAINFQAGQTRSNNATLALGSAGNVVVRNGMASGTVHVILDVNGFYE